jgi:hypothetical protein
VRVEGGAPVLNRVQAATRHVVRKARRPPLSPWSLGMIMFCV